MRITQDSDPIIEATKGIFSEPLLRGRKFDLKVNQKSSFQKTYASKKLYNAHDPALSVRTYAIVYCIHQTPYAEAEPHVVSITIVCMYKVSILGCKHLT